MILSLPKKKNNSPEEIDKILTVKLRNEIMEELNEARRQLEKEGYDFTSNNTYELEVARDLLDTGRDIGSIENYLNTRELKLFLKSYVSKKNN